MTWGIFQTAKISALQVICCFILKSAPRPALPKKNHQKENKVFKLTEHNCESLCKFQSVKVDQTTIQPGHDYLQYPLSSLLRESISIPYIHGT